MGQGVKAFALYSPCSLLRAPCFSCVIVCIYTGGWFQLEFLATRQIGS
jgi:hypothetical protein